MPATANSPRFVILATPRPAELELRVNARLEAGWRLHGSLRQAIDDEKLVWVQAMVFDQRREDGGEDWK